MRKFDRVFDVAFGLYLAAVVAILVCAAPLMLRHGHEATPSPSSEAARPG
jgi:hypothetical protein